MDIVKEQKIKNIEKIIKSVEDQRNGKELRARDVMIELLATRDFETVLDVGCGGIGHMDVFEKCGKKVHKCDMNPRYKPTYVGNFLDIVDDIPDEKYDCIWCSHTLEHQLNPGIFLSQIKRILKEDGYFALTVPPMKHFIVGGHVNHWTTGMLLHNLVSVGFDCSNAFIRAPKPEKFKGYPDGAGSIEPYDVSILIKKKDIKWTEELVRKMHTDYCESHPGEGGFGDVSVHDGNLYMSGAGLKVIKPFFPDGIKWVDKGGRDLQFDGRIGSK